MIQNTLKALLLTTRNNINKTFCPFCNNRIKEDNIDCFYSPYFNYQIFVKCTYCECEFKFNVTNDFIDESLGSSDSYFIHQFPWFKRPIISSTISKYKEEIKLYEQKFEKLTTILNENTSEEENKEDTEKDRLIEKDKYLNKIASYGFGDIYSSEQLEQLSKEGKLRGL